MSHGKMVREMKSGKTSEKAEIRKVMLERRRLVGPDERKAASAAVCAAIMAREDVKSAVSARYPFAVYVAMPDEIDLSPLVEAIWAEGVTLAVPCWLADEKRYGLAAYTSTTTLAAGRHGIPEPVEPCVVAPETVGVWIVPGLAFTCDGRRVGYGGGWYDRYLEVASPDSVSLGVAYRFQIVDDLPCDEHDIRVADVVVC